jgi:O-succinylbenzoic acid--CoA ligase
MTEPSLTRAALDAPARPALIASGVTLSFAELAERAERCRAALAAAGVTPGARVALIAGNAVETVVAIHALLDLGATLVPIHPRLTPAEADALLADASPALVLREADLRLLSLSPPPTPHLSPAPHLSPIPYLAPAPHLSPAPSPAAPLAIVYTSGTTGRAKGAVLSRRAFLAAAAASAQNLGWTEHDRWLCAMPLCHVGGLSILTRCLLARRAVILEPRFDPDAVLASVTRERATLLSVVPTMLQALLERDAGNALAGLRALLLGGAGAPFALLEECGRRGVPALTTYGLTEACSQVSVQRPSSPYRPARGAGVPLPGVEIRIVDGDDGGVGRIQVRGPTLMDGYFRGPQRPLDAGVDAAGWFDTGDLGELDAGGALHVHARRSDLIVTGGENVYPLEIEQRLETIPGVRRALVFGVPDARWGHLVAAALELAPGAALEPLAAEAAARMAPHKRPRLVCAVDALPLTGSGKLERARAAERYATALSPWPAPRAPAPGDEPPTRV